MAKAVSTEKKAAPKKSGKKAIVTKAARRGRPPKERKPEKPFKLPKGWEKQPRVVQVGYAGKLGMKNARGSSKVAIEKYIQKRA